MYKLQVRGGNEWIYCLTMDNEIKQSDNLDDLTGFFGHRNGIHLYDYRIVDSNENVIRTYNSTPSSFTFNPEHFRKKNVTVDWLREGF